MYDDSLGTTLRRNRWPNLFCLVSIRRMVHELHKNKKYQIQLMRINYDKIKDNMVLIILSALKSFIRKKTSMIPMYLRIALHGHEFPMYM